MARLLILILVFAFATPALAQVDPSRLEEIEREKERAEEEQKQFEAERAQAQADIDRLQTEMVNLAAEAQTYERAANEAEDRVAEFRAEEAQLIADIAADRRQLVDLLAALQRIERNPPPALATHPDNAKQAAQAAHLMGAISSDISERSEALKVRLENLQTVRRKLEAELVLLSEARADLDRRREAMNKLVGQKKDAERRLGKRSAEAEAEAARLASEADSLRELIGRFEAEARGVTPRVKPPSTAITEPRQAEGTPVPRLKPRSDRPPEPLELPPDTLRFADARGRLLAPAQGRLVSRFGEQVSGEKEQGITLSTRAGAQVLSPYYGRVEFAGPFKNYDNVVIINAGEGYFILLTGLGETFAAKGSNIRAGEPVGKMPNENDSPLYIEFRKNSQPIDPSPWIGTQFAG